jgi:uncharacterized membrane protein
VVLALELFDRFGFAGALRWLHVLFGIAWIGLLYYFNFVQVPAFAEMSVSARNEALTKLATRALWWFRWAALGTAIFGILIAGAVQDYFDGFFSQARGASIFVGMVLALTMLYNVWMVIWPNQKIVIANAANVLAGGQPDPGAAAAGRRAFLASRQNVLFSIPMLWFMVATSHFYLGETFTAGDPGSGKVWTFIIIALVIWAVLEANALGFIGGTAPGPTKQIYDTVRNVIISGFVLWAILWLLSEIILKS